MPTLMPRLEPPPPLYSLLDVLRLLMTSNLLYSAIVFLPLIPLCRLRLKGSCAPKRYGFQALTTGRDGATVRPFGDFQFD
ncbi:uncharacterized protein EI90DRAFT_3159510, partial [Cantharellus anzutake]|uniref:uncharacterized protein n=1 Tax=Cantharellus anzutake TaxID=1750568 RepID=UPI0019043D74